MYIDDEEYGLDYGRRTRETKSKYDYLDCRAGAIIPLRFSSRQFWTLLQEWDLF